MKLVLGALLILSLCGTGYLFQQQTAVKSAFAEQQSTLQGTLQAKDKELEAEKKELEEGKSELEKSKSLIESANKEIEDAKASQEPLQKSLDQLQKDFDAYKAKYRAEMRKKAVGEKLEQFVTAKKTYQNVTIKAVDPEGIDFIHADGAARVLFSDLSDEWKTRFDYDEKDAASFADQKQQNELETIQKFSLDAQVAQLQGEKESKANLAEIKKEIDHLIIDLQQLDLNSRGAYSQREKLIQGSGSNNQFGFGYSMNGADTSKIDEEIKGYQQAAQIKGNRIDQLILIYRRLSAGPYPDEQKIAQLMDKF